MNATQPQSLAMPEAWDNPMGTDGFEFIEYAAPDPAAIARLGADKGPAPFKPLYLRAPDAKLPGGITPDFP